MPPPSTFIERINALRRRRRRYGMCAEAGCQNESGDAYRCEKHAAMSAARVAKFRAIRKQRQRPSWG
jgi:hypothetical protein